MSARPADRVAGAVLVGGRSRRMGRDKALVPVDGRPMAARALAALADAGCAPLAVVGGDETHAVLGVDVVGDRTSGAGPLEGIATALEHHASAEAVVVVSCDLPDLDTATVGRLVARWMAAAPAGVEGDPPEAPDVVVAVTDRRQPLCALWATAALGELDALLGAGERAVRRALDRLRVAEVRVDPRPVTDVDTPAELAARCGHDGPAPRPG